MVLLTERLPWLYDTANAARKVRCIQQNATSTSNGSLLLKRYHTNIITIKHVSELLATATLL